MHLSFCCIILLIVFFLSLLLYNSTNLFFKTSNFCSSTYNVFIDSAIILPIHHVTYQKSSFIQRIYYSNPL